MSNWFYKESGEEATNRQRNENRTNNQDPPATRPTVRRTEGGGDYRPARRFLGRQR